jgi:hypothetical protein
MVPHPREVLDASTANQHDGVFLQIVPNSGNVGSDFYPVCKSNTRHFAQSRIRLFGCRRVHPRAYSTTLRTTLQSRTLRLVTNFLSSRSNQLIEGRQSLLSSRLSAQIKASIHPVDRKTQLLCEKPDEYSKAPVVCQGLSSSFRANLARNIFDHPAGFSVCYQQRVWAGAAPALKGGHALTSRFMALRNEG